MFSSRFSSSSSSLRYRQETEWHSNRAFQVVRATKLLLPLSFLLFVCVFDHLNCCRNKQIEIISLWQTIKSLAENKPRPTRHTCFIVRKDKLLETPQALCLLCGVNSTVTSIIQWRELEIYLTISMKALTLISRIEIIKLRTLTCDNNVIYHRSHLIDPQWFSQPLFWIIVWSTFIFIHDVTHRSHLDDQVLERIFSRSNLDHLITHRLLISALSKHWDCKRVLETTSRNLAHASESESSKRSINRPILMGTPLFNVQSRKRAVKLLDTSNVFTTQRNNKETCAFAYIFWFISTIHFLLF